MHHSKKPILAVIPCRKHFDFVEDVWKQEFDGKTLLERDIRVCLETNFVEKVVVFQELSAALTSIFVYVPH